MFVINLAFQLSSKKSDGELIVKLQKTYITLAYLLLMLQEAVVHRGQRLKNSGLVIQFYKKLLRSLMNGVFQQRTRLSILEKMKKKNLYLRQVD